jgi:UDP-glucose:(heptosyl)LPS alpha-1,3-glucosyltransferase
LKRVGLFLPRFSTYGGVEGFAHRLAGALADSGNHVTFVCARQEVQAPEGVTVVETGRPPLRSLKIARFAAAAERVRRDSGFDVTLSMGKTLRQDILRASGGPLSVFWRLSSRAWPRGAAREWKMLRRRLSPANQIIRRLERRSLEGSGKIVAVSHLVRDWLMEEYPHIEAENIEVVYNLPDLNRFSPPSFEQRHIARRHFGLKQNETTIGFAATNFRLKGLESLIHALAALPSGFSLLVAGGRDKAGFAHLSEKLGLAGRVSFLGKVEEMSRFYHALDLFALPSFYDTCSNAVLEARASGLPVVSTADNGSSYFLPDRWIVRNPLDFRTLADAIESAAGEPSPGSLDVPPGLACGIEPYLQMIEESAGSG